MMSAHIASSPASVSIFPGRDDTCYEFKIRVLSPSERDFLGNSKELPSYGQ